MNRDVNCPHVCVAATGKISSLWPGFFATNSVFYILHFMHALPHAASEPENASGRSWVSYLSRFTNRNVKGETLERSLLSHMGSVAEPRKPATSCVYLNEIELMFDLFSLFLPQDDVFLSIADRVIFSWDIRSEVPLDINQQVHIQQRVENTAFYTDISYM